MGQSREPDVAVHPLLPASSGGDQRPRPNRAAGIRQGQGHQPARAHPSSPRTQGSGGGAATAYAEVAVRGDFQRRGGARERRGSVAIRRRWVRIRSITRGWVMKATMRISCPQREHCSGSTSKERRSYCTSHNRCGRSGIHSAGILARGSCLDAWGLPFDRFEEAVAPAIVSQRA